MMAAQIPWLAPVMAGGFAVVLGLALLLWRDMRRSERLSARLLMVRSGGGPVETDPGTGPSPLLRIITAIGEAIARSGALSTRTLAELRQTLHVAGFRGENGLGLFVGTKLLLIVGLPLLVLIAVWLLHFNVPHPVAVAAVLAGVGLLAPDKVVRHLRTRYLRSLEDGMPDALDMMVICGQAGLGLESSIERVGVEMQVNVDSRVALLNFGKRTGLESARRLSAMLIQSMQYGTPMALALRTLSAEQRQEMLVKYETKAGRLPVLLTLPMIIFILPCVFLVVAGPAIVDVYRAMR
jgi:tight adherence protein C